MRLTTRFTQLALWAPLGLLLALVVGGCCGRTSLCCPKACCPRPCCPPPYCPQPCCRPACGPTAATVQPVASTPAPKSGGLLGDTAAFRENPERPGTWVWTKPNVDLRGYDDLLIEPIRAQPAEGSAFAALPEAERTAAAQALHAEVLRTVAPYYEVVESAGTHTLRVRVVLTSLPAADGTGAAAVEAELLDGQSQERLVAALGSLTAVELKAPDTGDAMAPAARAQRAWAARLLRYLDAHVR